MICQECHQEMFQDEFQTWWCEPCGRGQGADNEPQVQCLTCGEIVAEVRRCKACHEPVCANCTKQHEWEHQDDERGEQHGNH